MQIFRKLRMECRDASIFVVAVSVTDEYVMFEETDF